MICMVVVGHHINIIVVISLTSAGIKRRPGHVGIGVVGVIVVGKVLASFGACFSVVVVLCTEHSGPLHTVEGIVGRCIRVAVSLADLL